MDNSELEQILVKIYNLDPYWQKWEWLKIKMSNPELYKSLREIDELFSNK